MGELWSTEVLLSNFNVQVAFCFSDNPEELWECPSYSLSYGLWEAGKS